MEFIQPQVILSIHTHDPDHSKETSDVVLHHPFPEKPFFKALVDEFRSQEVQTLLNSQISPN
eukprot:CAMPEP_0170550108 /NCGR_PEP_ID=MMETSP0211-20121228/8167_1 /TAXON_ID=311385 /ORGANISM="Pseudokeronopsis sp., Strain OXSARD2" /LENGTH=61 /DNA_ID=CAMNT_0010856437 /DNA_START=21 /DNA_END=203 /DNA_ORIENTATION=-